MADMQDALSRSASAQSGVSQPLDATSADETNGAMLTIPSNRDPGDLTADTTDGLSRLICASEIQAENLRARQAVQLAEHHASALDYEVADRLYGMLASSLNPEDIEGITRQIEEQRSHLSAAVVPSLQLLVKQLAGGPNNNDSSSSGKAAHGGGPGQQQGHGEAERDDGGLAEEAEELGFVRSPRRRRQQQDGHSEGSTRPSPSASDAGNPQDAMGAGDHSERLARIEQVPASAAVASILSRVPTAEERVKELVRMVEGLRSQVADSRRKDADDEIALKAKRRQRLHRLAVAQREHEELQAELIALRNRQEDHDREFQPQIESIRSQHASIKTARNAADVLRLEAKALREEHEPIMAQAERCLEVVTRGGASDDIPAIEAKVTDGHSHSPAATSRGARDTPADLLPGHVRMDRVRSRCEELGYTLNRDGQWHSTTTAGDRRAHDVSRIPTVGDTQPLNASAAMLRGGVYVDPKLLLTSGTNVQDVIDSVIDVADEFFDDASVSRYLQRRQVHAKRYRSPGPSTRPGDDLVARQHKRPNGDQAFPTPPVPADVTAQKYRHLEPTSEAAETSIALGREGTAGRSQKLHAASVLGTHVPSATSHRQSSEDPNADRMARVVDFTVSTIDPDVAEEQRKRVSQLAEPQQDSPDSDEIAREDALRRKRVQDRSWRASIIPDVLVGKKTPHAKAAHASSPSSSSSTPDIASVMPASALKKPKAPDVGPPPRPSDREDDDGTKAEEPVFLSLADEIRVAAARRTRVIRENSHSANASRQQSQSPPPPLQPSVPTDDEDELPKPTIAPAVAAAKPRLGAPHQQAFGSGTLKHKRQAGPVIRPPSFDEHPAPISVPPQPTGNVPHFAAHDVVDRSSPTPDHLRPPSPSPLVPGLEHIVDDHEADLADDEHQPVRNVAEAAQVNPVPTLNAAGRTLADQVAPEEHRPANSSAAAARGGATNGRSDALSRSVAAAAANERPNEATAAAAATADGLDGSFSTFRSRAIPTYLELMNMERELDAGDVGEALRDLRVRQARTDAESSRQLLARHQQQQLDYGGPRQGPTTTSSSQLDAPFPTFMRSAIAGRNPSVQSSRSSTSGKPVLFSERKREASSRSVSQQDPLLSALSRPDGLRAQLDVMRLDASEAAAELRDIPRRDLRLPHA